MKSHHGIIEQLHLISAETRYCKTSCTSSKKEGTSAVLLQSGLDEKWWADSVECYCYLRNVQDLLADGKSQNERRSGESFKGPIILFGALVGYLPNSERDKARIHEFERNFNEEFYWLYFIRG